MAKKKNILMIVVDEERMPMHMPASVEFPARDWLRQRGVSFERYHVNTAPCTPSRAVIFTGLHTPRTRMIDNTNLPYINDMDTDIATLGDMAAAAGYYSVYKGKWHLANIAPSDDPRTTTENAMQGYGFNDFQHDGDLQSVAREGYVHDGRIAADTIYWLQDWQNYRQDESAETPFFMVTSFVNPHDIMTVDIDGAGTVQTQPEDPFLVNMSPPTDATYQVDHQPTLCQSWHDDFNRENPTAKPSAHREFDRFFVGMFGDIPKDADMWTDYVNYYINCQRDVDRHIMSVLQYLVDSGLDQETIIIFTADHGEMAGAHGLRTKGPFIYKESTNVPLIICHPDGRKGQTTPMLASSIDLAPTLMSICGLDQAGQASFPNRFGHDVSPAVFDPRAAGPRDSILFIYTALSGIDADFILRESKLPDLKKRGLLLGIHTGSHKFARYFSVLNPLSRPETLAELRDNYDLELYDLAADPDEIVNLANDPSHDDLLLDLNRQLNDLIRAEVGDLPFSPPVPKDLTTTRGVLT